MTSALGPQGEAQAAHFLECQGLRIVERHFLTKLGEIDLIARTNDTWVFVEVKTRTRATQPAAIDSITPAKQRRMTLAALLYMKKHRLEGENLRFDVVIIEEGEIDWIPSAFEPEEDFPF